MTHFDQKGEFSDIEDFEEQYLGQGGLFLVVTANDQVIGTGAIRQIKDQVCELKRLWLQENYQGQGIGYQILMELIDYARTKGYRQMWLETDFEQERAIRFYRRAGFKKIEKYTDRNCDLYLGLEIQPNKA